LEGCDAIEAGDDDEKEDKHDEETHPDGGGEEGVLLEQTVLRDGGAGGARCPLGALDKVDRGVLDGVAGIDGNVRCGRVGKELGLEGLESVGYLFFIFFGETKYFSFP